MKLDLRVGEMTFQGAMQKNAELQAIVEKLPKYADTGKPFVPGRDEAWIVTIDGIVSKVRGVMPYGHDDFKWEFNRKGDWVTGPAYSTQAAAEAAKEATECPQSNT